MKFYLTVLLTAFYLGSVLGQQETFRDADSLLRAISKANTDTSQILLKCKLSEAYRASKPDTSFILANQALAASLKINFDLGKIHSLLALSVLHREKGDLPLALDAGLKALKMSEEKQYQYELIYSLVRVANIYSAVRDVHKAITYLNKADDLLKIAYNDFQWSVVRFFLADAYEQLNELDAAEQQIKILEHKHNLERVWVILIKRMKANVAVKRNELFQAIEYYRESNSMAIAEKEYRNAATASNSMALVFRNLKQPDSAIFYAKEGLKYGQMLSYKNRVLAASSLLAELYEERNPQEAIKYYKIASETKDSLYGVQKLMQLQSATIKEQERQTETEAARLAYRNKVRQYVILAGAGVFLVIALILYRNNRQKQKVNKVLEATLSNLKS
ncbi:MAG: tetratricopeptide repeat protein, partial [Chitinophagaceae bacterium]